MVSARPLSGVAAATATLVIASAVQAQETVTGSPPDIVVLSDPLERPPEGLIQGSTVLSGAALDRRRQGTLGETLAEQPGVSATSFAPGASRPVIRGLGGDRIRVLQNGLSTFDAATTSPDHAVASDVAAADAIEVLRGPATLRFGNQAAGGVVNVINGRIPRTVPDDWADGEVRTTYRSVYDGIEGYGEVVAGAGPFAFHLDSFARSWGDAEIAGSTLSDRFLAANPGAESFSDILPNSNVETRGGGAGAALIGNAGRLGASWSVFDTDYGIPIEIDESIRIDLERVRYDAEGEWSRGFGPIASILFQGGYGNYQHEEVEGGEIGTVFSNDEYEARLEITQKRVGPWRGVIGGQYRYRDFAAVGEEAFVPPSVTDQYGLFAVQEFDFEPLSFEIGGRVERQESEAGSLGVSRDFTLASVSAGISAETTSTLTLGLSGHRTERAPTPEELFSNGPHKATNAFEIGDPTLDKETALGAEATARLDTARFDATVNVFLTEYDDFVTELPTGDVEDGLPVFRFQADDARFYGFETEAEWLALELEDKDIFLTLGADYVRATRDGPGDDDLPRIPPFRLLAGAEAAADFWEARIEAQWVAEQNNTAQFELPTDSYTLVNAFLTVAPFQAQNWFTISAEARNLLNEEARNHVSFLKDQVPLPGRGAALTVSAAF